MTQFRKRILLKKAKLWQVYFQSRKHVNDRDDITVNARNIDEAINKAIKNITKRGSIANKRSEIEKVELLATED